MDTYLRDNYARLGGSGCSVKLGISPEPTSRRAKALGLVKTYYRNAGPMYLKQATAKGVLARQGKEG